MYAFNIEYQREGNKYIAAPNEEFADSRDKIRELRQRVDRVMAIFTTSLMYMAAIESTEGISTGNSVYLLGGTVFQLASEILTKLFAQLQANERPNLKVTSHFNKGANEIGNIVDYFNYNIKKHGTSKKKTLGTLFLQSSYTFTL